PAEGELLLFAMLPNGVELFKPKSDGIDERVATRAAFVIQMNRQSLPIRLRLVFCQRRQIRIHAGRGLRHLLTQKLLAYEQTPGRRGCVRGLAGQREEGRL